MYLCHHCYLSSKIKTTSLSVQCFLEIGSGWLIVLIPCCSRSWSTPFKLLIHCFYWSSSQENRRSQCGRFFYWSVYYAAWQGLLDRVLALLVALSTHEHWNICQLCDCLWTHEIVFVWRSRISFGSWSCFKCSAGRTRTSPHMRRRTIWRTVHKRREGMSCLVFMSL